MENGHSSLSAALPIDSRYFKQTLFRERIIALLLLYLQCNLSASKETTYLEVIKHLEDNFTLLLYLAKTDLLPEWERFERFLVFLIFKGISCKSQKVNLCTDIHSMQTILHSPNNPHSNYTGKKKIKLQWSSRIVTSLVSFSFPFPKTMTVTISTFSWAVFLVGFGFVESLLEKTKKYLYDRLNYI